MFVQSSGGPAKQIKGAQSQSICYSLTIPSLPIPYSNKLQPLKHFTPSHRMPSLKTIINLCILFAIISAVFATDEDPAWIDSYNYYWSQNCDFFGNDIRLVQDVTWSECGATCRNDIECKFFTFLPFLGGWCFLKTAFNSKADFIPRYGGLCGFTNEDAEETTPSVFWRDAYYFYWASDCNFHGNDIGFKITANANDCAEACLRNGQCHFYTYSPGDSRCYIKNIADFNRKFKPSTVSVSSGATCGFFKPFITRPENPEVFWYDGELGYFAEKCMFSGPELKKLTGTIFTDCQRECAYTPGCTSFDWDDESGGECILHNTQDFNPSSVISRRGMKCGFTKPIA